LIKSLNNNSPLMKSYVDLKLAEIKL